MAEHYVIGQTKEKVVLSRQNLDKVALIDKSVGLIKVGQVLALNETSGKLVKYAAASADAKGAFTIFTGTEPTEVPTEDFKDTVACFGTVVDKAKVIGIEETDYAGHHKLYLAGIYLEEVLG